MNFTNKGKTPFYPGQPVPLDFFIGRINEIQRIARAIRQVELGKPQAIFLTGEYGIGKSSLASYMKFSAKQSNSILGIHAFLGSAETMEDMAAKTVEAIIKDRLYEPSIAEQIRNMLAKYVGKPEVLGFSVDFERLKADAPNISGGFLPFLRDLYERLKPAGIKGIMLILDEINGITANPKFSHFIKTLVDENAVSQNPIPLLLMLCGVEERRKDMIIQHQPVERIFDIVDIQPMNKDEVKIFFEKSFASVNINLQPDVVENLYHYSLGFPRVMHIIGDNVFWADSDGIIDKNDVDFGIISSAEDIGRKFVDQQVYKALRSRDYHSILSKLSKAQFDLAFRKSVVETGLSEPEKKKFNNFLQRMKKLNVLKSGDSAGEYVFTSRLVRLYLLLHSLEK